VKSKKIVPQLIALVVSVALVATHADLALAADVNVARAKKHFKQGQLHYGNGEYTEALERFEAAYSYKPLPGFLFNMGQCHMEMKKFDMALKRYNQYLRESPKARNRPKVEDLMRQASTAISAAATKPIKKQATATPAVKKPKVVKPQAPLKAALPVAKPVAKITDSKPIDDIPLAPLVVAPQEPSLTALTPTTNLVKNMSDEADTIYESWWFWSIATSVVAASISAVVLTQASPAEQLVAPSGTLGTIDRR